MSCPGPGASPYGAPRSDHATSSPPYPGIPNWLPPSSNARSCAAGRPPSRPACANLARLSAPIASDVLRALTHRPRRYVPIAGQPGDQAFVTLPGAFDGWHSVAPAQTTFENRITAASGLGMLAYDASRHAPRIRCPLLVCVSDNEDLTDPARAIRVAERAPRGEAIRYPADHFEVHFPPLFEQIVTDQVRFLRRHLHVEAGTIGRGAA